MSQSKRPAEATNQRNVKIRRDKVGELEQSMVHFYMEKYEEMAKRHRHAMAVYRETERRAERLYRDRQELSLDLHATQIAFNELLHRYENEHNLLMQVALALPLHLRHLFEDRLDFITEPQVINLISDEEMTDSD